MLCHAQVLVTEAAFLRNQRLLLLLHGKSTNDRHHATGPNSTQEHDLAQIPLRSGRDLYEQLQQFHAHADPQIFSEKYAFDHLSVRKMIRNHVTATKPGEHGAPMQDSMVLLVHDVMHLLGKDEGLYAATPIALAAEQEPSLAQQVVVKPANAERFKRLQAERRMTRSRGGGMGPTGRGNLLRITQASAKVQNRISFAFDSMTPVKTFTSSLAGKLLYYNP